MSALTFHAFLSLKKRKWGPWNKIWDPMGPKNCKRSPWGPGNQSGDPLGYSALPSRSSSPASPIKKSSGAITGDSWAKSRNLFFYSRLVFYATRDVRPGSIVLVERWYMMIDRPQRWSIFQSDGMVNVFFQATIDFNGFLMVLTTLDHHH